MFFLILYNSKGVENMCLMSAQVKLAVLLQQSCEWSRVSNIAALNKNHGNYHNRYNYVTDIFTASDTR